MFREFVLEKKICSPSCQPCSIALAKSAFRKLAHAARAVHEKEKIMQKSGLLEALPRRQFKEYRLVDDIYHSNKATFIESAIYGGTLRNPLVK